MRLNRSTSPARPASGVVVSLAEYGLDDVPPLDADALPGATVEERAEAYVSGLDLSRGARRGMVAFRAACALDDLERSRAGRPSFEEEVLADL